MSDSPIGIGSSRVGSGLSVLRQALGVDGTRDRESGRSAPGVTGRPGNRMLSPDVPVESLDRSAQRGTYLDILV
ncbi:MAG: hypothetical protein EPN20_18255 [Magnetospirillum sp.]|nr:MAG: hypothetical protein EPN20_18255 [Magnetospirillum sp.]